MIIRIADPADALAPAFLDYCAAHGAEHDESYIPGSSWAFDDEYPSFALADAAGRLGGAAAFMLSASFQAARRARVAIFHTLGAPSAAAYRPLLDAARAALAGRADDCYLFLPEELGATRAAFEDLGFVFERTAYLMSAPAISSPTLDKARALLPAGYGLRVIEKTDARGSAAAGGGYPEGLLDFIAVRNRNFRELLGSMDARPEDLVSFMSSADYLPGGLALAVSPAGVPCATLRVERDDEEGSGFIGTLSVDKEHRGKGLARALVRLALALCRQAGFSEAFLSVNAENRTALGLYESEGFSVVKAMSCLALRLTGPRPRAKAATEAGGAGRRAGDAGGGTPRPR